MPMTKHQAADVRTLLASYAGLSPRSGEVASAACRLDTEVSGILDTTPALGRQWARTADRHMAAELAALEAAEPELEDEEVPA